MSKFSTAFASLLLLSSISAFAEDVPPTPDYDDCYYYSFDIWFDPMGVLPCQMVLEYAEEMAVSAEGTKSVDNFIDPGFSFGFKLGASVESHFPAWTFGIQYMWWDKTYKSSTKVTGPSDGFVVLQPKIGDTQNVEMIFINPNESGSVKTSLEYDYDLLDFYAGWSCCLCNGLEFVPYMGFRAFWYDTYLKETSADSTGIIYSARGDTSKVSNDFDAYGFMGGVALKWNIGGALHFFGSFGGSFVGGRNKNKIDLVSTGLSGTNFSLQEEQCLFVHSLEGKFGLDYSWCWCSLNYLLGVYYEVTQWNRVLPHPFRQNSTSPGNATLTSNGLFLQSVAGRIGINF